MNTLISATTCTIFSSSTTWTMDPPPPYLPTRPSIKIENGTIRHHMESMGWPIDIFNSPFSYSNGSWQFSQNCQQQVQRTHNWINVNGLTLKAFPRSTGISIHKVMEQLWKHKTKEDITTQSTMGLTYINPGLVISNFTSFRYVW